MPCSVRAIPCGTYMPHDYLRHLAGSVLPVTVKDPEQVAHVRALLESGHLRAVMPDSLNTAGQVRVLAITPLGHQALGNAQLSAKLAQRKAC